jgi:hypothetical protein
MHLKKATQNSANPTIHQPVAGQIMRWFLCNFCAANWIGSMVGI